jgi:hypothetical protein
MSEKRGTSCPGRACHRGLSSTGSTRSSTSFDEGGDFGDSPASHPLVETLRVGIRHDPEPSRPGGFGEINGPLEEKTPETGPLPLGNDPEMIQLDHVLLVGGDEHAETEKTPVLRDVVHAGGRNSAREGFFHDERDMGLDEGR